ncbi:MAG: thermonuclease family protein [Planctomycetes bacterium]|nr:thermonuclease family protein [Planctomycetota bacterium]MBU1518812.1 thermonuclease family protein [Planctomycetota bacterium]MBU2458248.1 thermonuclease family protein [Planctomycetota bacterium]
MKNRKIKYAQSRLQRNILLLSAFLLLSAVVWLDRNVIHHNKPAANEQKTSISDWDKYDGKSFTVVKVVDGDTIDINIPDGKYDHTRIRLWGVDTPETKNTKLDVMYFGPEATEFTTKLSLEKQVAVYLDDGNNTRGKYGRLLAYVKLPDGEFLNEALLSEGFAYADTRFEHSQFEKYIQLEETARKEKKGLWEKVTPDQMPQWRRIATKAQRHKVFKYIFIFLVLSCLGG